MCFLPKALLKTIITVVGFAIIAGAAAMMYFGQVFLNNEAFDYFTREYVSSKYGPTAVLYGVGACLIVVALVQLYACKTENRCLIFLVYSLVFSNLN